MRHIGFYNSGDAVQKAIDNEELGKPYVVYLNDEHRLDWNSTSPSVPVYSAMPLTFEIISGGTIVWKSFNADFSSEIEYTTNNGQSWNSLVSTEAGAEINVNAGDIVQFRGNAVVFESDITGKRNSFQGTALFNAYGNPLSISHKDDFSTILDLREQDTFACLFSNNTGIVDAGNMALVATGLSKYCYMFMFEGCTNLTTAPSLPATVLSDSCYWKMFIGCSNLVTAPELLAPTLVNNCYRQMFESCGSLNYIKCLATNPVSSGSFNPYTQYWVKNVAGTGTFVKHPNANWATGRTGIPAGWTIIDAEI